MLLEDFSSMYLFKRVYLHSKMKRKIRRFLIYSCPHTCRASLIINILHQGGTFVTIHESAWTQHHHPKSRVYLRAHSWSFYGCGQMYNDMFCKKVPNCLPKWLYHFVFPPAMNENSCCFTSWLAFGIISVPDFDE